MVGGHRRYGFQSRIWMKVIADMDFSRGYGWRSQQIWISVEDMDEVIADMDFSRGYGWRS